MTDQEIKDSLNKALDWLYDNDHHLLNNSAHERSIAHCLAVHLKELFHEYDVDVEYDLDAEKTKGNIGGKLKKEIEILESELEKVKILIKYSSDESIKEYSDVLIPKSVYPDIIIHKRQTNQDNLLIIEIKKSLNNNSKAIHLDKIKLQKYTNSHLKYQLGAYINLSV